MCVRACAFSIRRLGCWPGDIGEYAESEEDGVHFTGHKGLVSHSWPVTNQSLCHALEGGNGRSIFYRIAV